MNNLDRFKFRLWDKKNKLILYGNAIATIECAIQYPEQYILIQSTGLKDRNNKLIYEGDILKRYDLSEQQIEVEGDIDIVEWSNGGFNINFGDGQCSEIIGNKFVNKELLK